MVTRPQRFISGNSRIGFLLQCSEENKGYAKNNQRVREEGQAQGNGKDKQAFSEGNQWFDDTIQRAVDETRDNTVRIICVLMTDETKKKGLGGFVFW